MKDADVWNGAGLGRDSAVGGAREACESAGDVARAVHRCRRARRPPRSPHRCGSPLGPLDRLFEVSLVRLGGLSLSVSRAGAAWAVPAGLAVAWAAYPALTPKFKHRVLPSVFPDPEAEAAKPK